MLCIGASKGRFMPDRVVSAGNYTTFYGALAALVSGLTFSEKIAIASFLLAVASFLTTTVINIWYKLSLIKIERQKLKDRI